MRRATWDDLNTPARLPILLGAGLPLLLPANPGHLVAVQRVILQTGAGVLYHDADDLADRLHAEVADRSARAAALAARHAFTYDAHADRLVTVLRRAAAGEALA